MNTSNNEPIVIEPFKEEGEDSSDYIAMERVQIEVKVPQTNASVYDMMLNQDDKDWIRNNGEYDIATYNNEHHTNYVGYNPVRVKVPNGTMKLTGDNKITTNNTTITLNDMKQKVPAEDVLMLVGCDEVRVEIPEDITIPEVTEGTQTVMNITPLIEESGKYTITKWKLDNLDEIPEGVKLSSIKGFNEVEVKIPNKLVNMNSELPMSDSDHPNTGTIDTNGTYDITWWKNNSINVPNKEDYIGFNNIKVNVEPKILSDQVVNIPSNNYVLNINNIWNNAHPNDKKDGFNNITVHYNESGSGGSSDLVNAVIQSNNTLSQTIISQSNNAALQMITLNNQTIYPILDRLVNGFEEVKLYLLQNRLNSSNQYMYSVTNNINNESLTAPNRLIEVSRVLTPQQLTELNALVGGDTAKIKMVLDLLYIKLLGVDEEGQIRPLIANDNSNNTRELPPPEESQQNRLVKRSLDSCVIEELDDNGNVIIDDTEPPKKRMRGDVPKYEIATYKRDYLFSTKNINDDFSKDFYATYSCNQVIKTEMLEYDTLTLEKSDLGTTVQYDIEIDFYNSVDNPLVPDDPQQPDGPGHYEMNPLGVRKLNIVVPTKTLKTTNTEQTRASATVNFNNTNQGLATISLSNVNYDGFESPVYATITGTNFPGNNLYNPYPSNAPLQISSNTQTTQSITFDSSNYDGLNTIYYNVDVQSTINNYNPYPSSNRINFTRNGSGSITFSSTDYTGLDNIYYNVNVKPDLVVKKGSSYSNFGIRYLKVSNGENIQSGAASNKHLIMFAKENSSNWTLYYKYFSSNSSTFYRLNVVNNTGSTVYFGYMEFNTTLNYNWDGDIYFGSSTVRTLIKSLSNSVQTISSDTTVNLSTFNNTTLNIYGI